MKVNFEEFILFFLIIYFFIIVGVSRTAAIFFLWKLSNGLVNPSFISQSSINVIFFIACLIAFGFDCYSFYNFSRWIKLSKQIKSFYSNISAISGLVHAMNSYNFDTVKVSVLQKLKEIEDYNKDSKAQANKIKLLEEYKMLVERDAETESIPTRAERKIVIEKTLANEYRVFKKDLEKYLSWEK